MINLGQRMRDSFLKDRMISGGDREFKKFTLVDKNTDR